MSNNWIEFVKKYQQEHNISYKEALSKAGASYKSGGALDEGQLPQRADGKRVRIMPPKTGGFLVDDKGRMYNINSKTGKRQY